ncbi:MAG: DUF2238 domain-containing protein [Hydrogenophaga sp.]|nr:DUF2238 domain-containing protein [Hydrogenophaga sp.]
MPQDRRWQAHKGLTFNALRGWERGHTDRLVHLAYGLLPASEVTESLGRVVRVHSALWMCIISARSMGVLAMVCDLVAWGTALVATGPTLNVTAQDAGPMNDAASPNHHIQPGQ